MSEPPLFTKLCNAFYPNAEGRTELLPDAAAKAVENYKRKHGGLWVGGRVIVWPDQINFTANGMNMAFNRGASELVVPFDWVRTVEWEFGVLTGIVVVRCEDFDFRFRCFGARGVVKRLGYLVGIYKKSMQSNAQPGGTVVAASRTE